MGIKHIFILLLTLLPLSASVMTDNTSTNINDRQCFDITYNETSTQSVSNITLLINIDHTYRRDLKITLTSPSGTKIDIIDNSGGSSDNLYVLFDDNARTDIEDDFTSHSTTVQREPEDNFSDFNGENAQGIWRLRICDEANGDIGSYNSSTLTITTDVNFLSNNTRPFEKVLINGNIDTNIAGDLLVIGNQSLCDTPTRNGTPGVSCQQPLATATNNAVFQNHVNLDPQALAAGYQNSTSSDLNLSDDDYVVEAWLYWIGRFINNVNVTTLATADTIFLKTPTSNNYVRLRSDPSKFNWMFAPATQTTDAFFDYGAAVNVTDLVRSGGSGTYWVADLQTTPAFNQGSGWALAIIVEDKGFPKRRTVKNISLFDGFTGVYSLDPNNYPATVTSNISGFLTPKTGPINSNLIVFAGESDRGLNDSMTITTQNGTAVNIQDSRADPQNLQNATISKNGVNVTTRNPNFENTLGIDIDEINLANIIEHNQTQTTITVNSLSDRIFLSMYGFSTDLYIPEVCYDYTVARNGYDITLDERKIKTYEGNLSITLALKSLEGDFDFENSQISVRLIPTESTSFQNAYYSPDGIDTLIDAIHTTNSTPTRPNIAIGENINIDGAGLSTGGTITINQRYFAQFNYLVTPPNNGLYEGRFEVDFNTTIDFGSGDVPIFKSTESGSIPRCPQSLTYRPTPNIFNVQRQNTENAATDAEKYTLWTQVVGKPFNFDVVAYDTDYSTEINIGEDETKTIDLELINADPFNDEDNVFTCTNPDSSIVIPLTSTGKRHLFVPFNGESRIAINGITTDTALRNAAFRIWYIRDNNGSIIPHDCPDPQDDFVASNSCFETVYETYLEADDNITLADGTVGFCGTTSKYGSCSNYQNTQNGTEGCYACLRDHFSDMMCSRDNFAIRPASYRVSILDNLENIDIINNPGTTITQNDTTNTVPLAAGYRYRLSGHASSYISANTPARGYNTLLNNLIDNTIVSRLNFDTSINPAECIDQNSTNWDINFDGGVIQPVLVSHNNVGNYLYRIEDTNWTIVDQGSYPYKPFPNVNDCTSNSNAITTSNTGMNGCLTNTTITTNGATYTDLALQYQPYSFDIGNVSLQILDNNNSNYMFMNDFDNEGYTDPIPRPLSMAATFIGDVIARAKGGAITTNFNANCAAVDLNLALDKNISRSNNGVITNLDDALLNGSLAEDTVTSPSDTATPNVLVFQQYLQVSNSSLVAMDTVNQVTAPDGNTTIRASAFSPQTPDGTASIRLYTNFKKPLEPGVTRLVNPIDINYTRLRVDAPTAISNAEGQLVDTTNNTGYIPDGNNTYNRSITALFSRVVFSQPLNENIIANEIILTAMVDIYCTPTTTVSCADYNLTTPTREISNENGWFSAAENASTATTSYYNAFLDGDASINANVVHGSAVPSLNNNANLPIINELFDGPAPALPGTIADLNLSIPVNTGRPVTIDVSITPEPWHRFFPGNAKGIPNSRNIFQGPSAWSGVGNTGLTGQATSSNANPRMNW